MDNKSEMEVIACKEHQLQLMCELLGTPSPRIWPGLEKLKYESIAFKLPEKIYNNLGLKFPDLPDSCLDLLNRLLTFDPEKRASANNCLRHRWFVEPPAPQDFIHQTRLNYIT